MEVKKWEWTGSGGSTAVIYQIYPRSFYDSTATLWAISPAFIEKLDYLSDLGVDGIWLSR